MSSRPIFVAVGLVISAALLWWALHDTDLQSIIDRTRAVDKTMMGAAIGLGILSLPLRAVRWRSTLMHLEDPPTFRAAYHATTLGAFANNVLPARAGEVVAVSALGRLSGVPILVAGSSLALTHLIDVAVLVALAGVGLIVDTPDSGFGEAETVRNVLMVGGAVVAVGLVLSWSVLVRGRRSAADTFWSRAAVRVADGLGAFENRMAIARVVCWTTVVWLATGTAWWLGLRALDLDVSFATALVVQTVVAIGIIIPSAPGFFGPFESASRIGLSLYVVDAAAAAESAVAYHLLVFFLPVVAMGALSLMVTGLRPGTLGAAPAPRERTEEPARQAA